MSASTLSNKKRKSSSGEAIAVSVHRPAEGSVTPVLGLFPSTQPPRKTPFSLYTRSGQAPKKYESNLLAAETDEIEFESRNHLGLDAIPSGSSEGETVGEDKGYSAQYLLGVHDPSTNSLTLHAAPLHTFHPTIKSLKDVPSTSSAASLISAQRAALGATFGTKKAQRQLNAQARNKLSDSSYGNKSMSSALQGYLAGAIQGASQSLPSKIEIDEMANTTRSTIPVPNLLADKVENAYPLDGIVTKGELGSIELDPFVQAENFKARIALLAFRRSRFVNDRLKRLIPSRSSVEEAYPTLGKKDKEKVRLLIYVSILFQFRQATQGGKGEAALARPKLKEKLGETATPTIVDGLLERFTETQRSGADERIKMTSTMEIKLLSYLLILCLRIDSYATDVGTIASDLGIGSKRVGELFRSLGAHLLTPSAAERERLVQTNVVKNASEARSRKQAVLRIPLEFPQDKRAAPKR